jgi:hypothetical protein
VVPAAIDPLHTSYSDGHLQRTAVGAVEGAGGGLGNGFSHGGNLRKGKEGKKGKETDQKVMKMKEGKKLTDLLPLLPPLPF